MKIKPIMLALLLCFSATFVIAQANWTVIDCYAPLGPTVGGANNLNGSDVFLDRNGSPWVAYRSSSYAGKLGRIVDGEWVFSPVPESSEIVPLPPQVVSKVAFDEDNTAWVIGTVMATSELYSFADGNWQTVTSSQSIKDVYTFDGDPAVYMVFNNSVERFNPSDPNNSNVLYYQSSSASTVQKIAKDNNGNLILYKRGSETDSLLTVNTLGTVTASYDITNVFAGLGGTQFRQDMKVSSDGHLWFYLSTGYVHTLVEFDGEQHTIYQMDTPASMPDALCNNMVMDNDVIWLYYDGHIVQFSNGQFHTEQVIQAPSWNTFGYSEMNFRKDAQNNIWYIGRVAPIGEYRLCVVNPHGLATFTGRTFHDENDNGVYDSGEAPATFAIQTPDGFTLPVSEGYYGVFGFDPGQDVTLTAIAPQYYQLSTAESITVNMVTGPLTGLDFGIRPGPDAQDLYVTQTSSACRPGFAVTQWVSYGNRGNLTTDASISYTYDPQLTYVAAVPEPTTILDNVLTWQHDALQPFTDSTMTVHFTLGADASIMDTLYSNATIQPIATDELPDDNIHDCSDPITGSYDPNDKTATPEEIALPDQWIDYRIRFQNTGNDTAFNIHLLDTLSLLLDLGTIAITGHSHPMRYALNGRILEFWFDDILLPDTFTNEPLSHGFVQYRVRTGQDLSPGQEVTNTAYIYFDFNQPIITNTTVNTVPEPDNVPESSFGNVWTAYPNPNDGTFQLRFHEAAKGAVEIELYDLQGRSLLREQWTSASETKTIDAHQCASGYYLLSVTVNGQRSVSRLVIR